jgi:hypothetical protein
VSESDFVYLRVVLFYSFEEVACKSLTPSSYELSYVVLAVVAGMVMSLRISDDMAV